MLRSRGISQIYHTYSEDMHPVYILLVGVVYPIHNLLPPGTIHIIYLHSNDMKHLDT